MKQLAEAMAARGHRARVLSSAHASCEPEIVNGVEVFGAGAPNLYDGTDGDKKAAWRRLAWHAIDEYSAGSAVVARHIGDFAPDIMNSHNISGLTTSGWRGAYEAQVPIVHTLHDYYLLCPRTTRRRHDRNCERQCLGCRALTLRRRPASDLLSGVISVSRHVLEVHRRAGLFSRVPNQWVINNAVPAPAAAAAPASAAGAPLRIGFIGRPDKDKGFWLLLEAFALLREDAELTVAGRLKPDIVAAVAQHPKADRIRLLGFAAREDFYPAVDLVVVPSLWEDPYPTVILEAASWGRPVLGARRGGIPEAIRGTLWGWSFDPSSPRNLSDVVNRLAAYPEELAEKTGGLAVGGRTVDELVDDYESAYRTVLSGRGSSVGASAAALSDIEIGAAPA